MESIGLVVSVAVAENAARHSAGRSRTSLSEVHRQREIIAGPHRISFRFTAVYPYHRSQVS